MIREEIKQLKTGTRELRNFGLLVGVVFAALGLLFWLRGKAHYPYFLVPSILLLLLGAAFPTALKYVYIAWMCLVIAPIGLAARLFGKDFLRLKLDRRETTYWITRKSRRPQSPAEYGQQF